MGGFVSGHGFSRAVAPRRIWALAPVYGQTARHADPDNIVSPARTFFATTKTSQGRALLQSERNAALIIGMTIEKAMQFIKEGFPSRLKTGTGLLGGLAARVLRGARRRYSQLRATSGVYCARPGESRSRRFAREVPVLLYVLGGEKGRRG